jgi:hypothetical protein
MKKIISTPNGIEEVNLTAEEIIQKETDEKNFLAEQEILKAEKETNDALKASAKAKLIAGEALTEDEANTIVL